MEKQKMSKKKKIIYILAIVLVVEIVAVLICCRFCCADNNASDTPVVEGAESGGDEVTIDLANAVIPDPDLSGDDVVCEAFESNGIFVGYIMRFAKTDETDEILRSQDNIYFAFIGDREIIIPSEEINIVPSLTTAEYSVTLLIPDGDVDSFSGKTLSFCAATREGTPQEILFMAEAVL